MKTSLDRSSAFTLVELLAVIAIIGIIAAAGTVAISNTSQSLSGAASAASTMFGLARTEAIMRRVPARVIVDTVYDSARPDNYLRRMAVIVRKDTGTDWEQVTRWTELPGQAFYNQNASREHAAEIIPGITSGRAGAPVGPYGYFEFSPSGQASARAQFVVSKGTVQGGNFQEIGNTSRAGFFVHKMGKLTFFADPLEIPTPW